jgi:hypothetical protein
VDSEPFHRDPQILAQSLAVSAVIVLPYSLQEPVELVGAILQPGVVASREVRGSRGSLALTASEALAGMADVSPDLLGGVANLRIELGNRHLPEQYEIVRETRERVETLRR